MHSTNNHNLSLHYTIKTRATGSSATCDSAFNAKPCSSRLQQVVGVVERRQTLPVLANLLVSVDGGRLADRHRSRSRDGRADRGRRSRARRDQRSRRASSSTSCVHCPTAARSSSSRPASARSCSAGRSRFTLATLPATEFPVIENIELIERVTLPEATLKDPDGSHALRDGASGRALLPQRHAARSARALRCAAWRPTAIAWRWPRRRSSAGDDREPPDHRAAQGRAGAAGPVRGRRRHGRARVRTQPPARHARRRHVHLQADRRPLPGLRSGRFRSAPTRKFARTATSSARRCSARRSCRTRSTAA